MRRIWVDVAAVGVRGSRPIMVDDGRQADYVSLRLAGHEVGRLVYSHTRGPTRTTRVWLEIESDLEVICGPEARPGPEPAADQEGH